MSNNEIIVTSTEVFTGIVKWFNNKAGYGFLTIISGPKVGTDVFVHHSSIKVDAEQYKYLVQGEYIEFQLADTKTENHQYQATCVSGINGGKIMCETRQESRTARSQYSYVEECNPETETEDSATTHGEVGGYHIRNPRNPNDGPRYRTYDYSGRGRESRGGGGGGGGRGRGGGRGGGRGRM